MLMKTRTALLALLIAAPLILAACSSGKPEAAKQQVTLFKSEYCGCCDVYAQYLAKGFSADIQTIPDMTPIKEKYSIPKSMESCHTTVAGAYFVEGHVPKEAVDKLLAEKPDIAGIAMPGMPSGSPGMPGGKTGPFIIYAVQHDGRTAEFMRI